MRPALLNRSLGVLAAGAAIALAGCSDSATAPGAAAVGLSPAEVDEITVGFEDDADLSVDALFHGGTLNAFNDMTPAFSWFPGVPPRMGPVVDCLVIEPLPPEDPDGDGIPTRLALRFDPDPCVLGRGRTALEFSGSITVVDPVPDVAGYDVDETIDHLGFAHTLPNGRAITLVRNGTRGVRQDTGNNRLTAVERLTSSHTTPGRAFQEASVDWTLTFDGDDAIVFRQPIPSGSLTIEGDWSFANQTHNRMFNVTTVTPLRYDATCSAVRPILRFSEGQIRKTLMRDGVARAVITLTWTGCGVEPTRKVSRPDGTI